MKSDNITWQYHSVSKRDRSILKFQRPCIIWFTGLSGAGKSTIADAVEQKLFDMRHHTYLLDGDNVRHGINNNLGFSDADRVENIRRIGEMAKLFTDAGIIVLSAFISPFKSDREMVRKLVQDGEFIEVFIDTPLAECEKRDIKGLYKKARAGEIKNFTGIDSEYQRPTNPEIVIDTVQNSIEQCAKQVIEYLKAHSLIEIRRIDSL
jgi:adenylylsulfate kinase